jgi:ADP-dependent NAD(P)H-hydrate dehydratase / NAD(P)H-hydrate epimerase
MKILSVEKIREADAYTIKNEPVPDIDLMERAATSCFYWMLRNLPHGKKVRIFAGSGNNGGDGLVVARLLAGKAYHVEVFMVGDAGKLSPSCKVNYDRLREVGLNAVFINEKNDLPLLNQDEDILVDALFGSGLTRAVTGFAASVIDHMNSSGAMTIAIDVPSGLFCDESSTTIKNASIIRAAHTLTFSPPKLAFFFPENYPFVGDWHLFEIGIMKEFIDQAGTKNFVTDREECRSILKPREKFSHKGTYGHALLFCGGHGKLGAAVLAGRACLRSGPGLVTVHVPQNGIGVLQSAVPEAMLDIDRDAEIFSEIHDLSPFSSIAVGPGIGKADQTGRALKHLIQESHVPLVIDADAINILGENKTWISFIPKESIFTPHPREFERLVGKSSGDFDRNKMQRDFSVKHGVYVVLKGAHTAITTPGGNCYFNSTGNPGMATGGSGDVLTGILAGLMAQHYTALETCLLGVYLHGLAGDYAAEATGQEALIAGDIITHLGKAFQSLYG